MHYMLLFSLPNVVPLEQVTGIEVGKCFLNVLFVETESQMRWDLYI